MRQNNLSIDSVNKQTYFRQINHLCSKFINNTIEELNNTKRYSLWSLQELFVSSDYFHFVIMRFQYYTKVKRQFLISFNEGHWLGLLSDISYLHPLCISPVLDFDLIIGFVPLYITALHWMTFSLTNLNSILSIISKGSSEIFTKGTVCYIKVGSHLADTEQEVAGETLFYDKFD